LLRQIGKALTATDECGARKAGATTGTKFVYRVCKLMEELARVKPHYVRCVKSNDSVDKEWEFDARFCFQQLQYVFFFFATALLLP
jgi:myosin heavy subunit